MYSNTSPKKAEPPKGVVFPANYVYNDSSLFSSSFEVERKTTFPPKLAEPQLGRILQ